MYRFLKYFACFIVILSFGLIIYASQEEIDTAKEAMQKYCQEDYQGLQGCIYDKNDTLYTKSGNIKNSNFSVVFTSANLDLTRGYVTANAQGELLFAGCYKGHTNGGNYITEGDYYVFKIVALSGGKCKVIDNDIVFAKGTKFKTQLDLIGLIYFWNEFDGTSLGSPMATYIDWLATNGGECPIGFGLVANTRWYTSTNHKYVFSNDGTAYNIGVNSFWGNEKYVTTPGCTVQDKTGHEEAEACFNEAAKKIDETQCPSDYSKLGNLASTLEGYQDSCDNKFRTLYSKGLLESDAEEMKDKLVTAVKNKLLVCQNKKCNVSDFMSTKLAETLSKEEYKLCKTGNCPASSYANQSTSPNAKCYRIGNGTQATFEWTETPSRQPAYVESNISKSECYGTYDTKNCRDCLKKAYKATGFSNEQINCLLNIEAEKSLIAEESEREIEEQFAEKNEEKLQESAEIREKSYQSYDTPVAIIDPTLPGQGSGSSSCTEILGPNLTAIVKVSITIIQIAGAIIAIVKGMMALIPPILSKDAEALNKALKTLKTMAIILVVIFLFKPLLRFIGNILDFDVSCIL